MSPTTNELFYNLTRSPLAAGQPFDKTIRNLHKLPRLFLYSVTLATLGTRRTIRKLRFQVDAGIRITIKRRFNPSIRQQTQRLDVRGNGPSLELNHSSEYVFFKTRRKFEATLLNSEIIRCQPTLFKTQYSTDHTYFPTQIATLS